MPQTDQPGVTVGELADTVSVTHPFNKPELVFLNTSDIERGQFLHRTYSRVAAWPGQAKKSIRRGDILFSEIRPANGRYAFVDFDADDYVVSTKLMVIRPKPGKVSPRFLYHFLTSPKITGWLQHLAESRSGTFPQITFDQVAELELPRLTVDEQQQIGELFDAIDDKIEQNRRTGAKLEGLARAVFKAWFVDFEPVKVKAAGATAFPGMPPETFAALSNTLQDSPLGPVPQGWKIKPLSECISHLLDHRGKTPKKLGGDWASVGGTPALSAKNVKAGRIIRSELNNFVDEAMFRRWMPEPLELNDIVMTSEAPLGELTYLARHADYCLSQRVFGIRADPDVIEPSVLYRFLESNAGQSQLLNRATGTTVIGIRQSELRKLEIPVAPISIQRAASTVLQPIADQLAQLEEISEKVATIRDYLLPRLLSGRVRVGVTNG